MNYKIISIGLLIILLGVFSWLAEKYFYDGRLDNDYIVQESLFLPLAFILSGIGLVVIIVSILIDMCFYTKK